MRLIAGSPGSTSDISARFVAHKLSERWGQQIVVDNRAGAGGIIGAEIAARAAPDGYTLMVQSATHLANAHLYKNLPYDTLGDFIGVSGNRHHVGNANTKVDSALDHTKALIARARHIGFAGEATRLGNTKILQRG